MKAQFWAIPTVKVADGGNLITDLREGDRAEVVATFVGEPPFSWRYARMEAVYDEKHHAKHGKRPKILDTHTERNIQGYTDTFTTLTEGNAFCFDFCSCIPYVTFTRRVIIILTCCFSVFYSFVLFRYHCANLDQG